MIWIVKLSTVFVESKVTKQGNNLYGITVTAISDNTQNATEIAALLVYHKLT